MDEHQEEVAETMEAGTHARCVTYLPPSTIAWLQSLANRLSNVDRKVSISELIRDAVHQGSAKVEQEVNLICELRVQGVRT